MNCMFCPMMSGKKLKDYTERFVIMLSMNVSCGPPIRFLATSVYYILLIEEHKTMRGGTI